MQDYARLCEIMRDYANQRKYMRSSQAFARHLFVRGMRARIRKQIATTSLRHQKSARDTNVTVHTFS